jgi:hypothetical protein
LVEGVVEMMVKIDIGAKIAEATTQDEKDAWESYREKLEKFMGRCGGFNEGWDVWIYKQACGHWEVLQCPVVGGRTVKDVRDELTKESKKRKCTRCICHF